MTAAAPELRTHGNAYNIFILVLTVGSLAIMVLLLLPLDENTRILLTAYDNAICLVFLGDFAYNISGARPRRGYFIGQRGWLDLLGSIPTLGIFQFTALFRLARLSRLARISKLLRGNNRKELVRDVVQNRGQYATFITLLAGGLVLTVASTVVLQVESRSPDANITTAGDALWWGFVTITTVGYGDQFPVTLLGRSMGVLLMLAGIGIIGALASILASLLVPPPKEEEAVAAAPAGAAGAVAPDGTQAILAELASLRSEVAALRESLQSR